ncbi:MAG: hypothetical protein ABIO70_23590 [Pseudomonadota bacterium]
MTRSSPFLPQGLSLLVIALLSTHPARADRWDSTNNPDRFGGDLSLQVSDLPTAGAVDQAPWPPSYTPVYALEASAPDAVIEAADLWLPLSGDARAASWSDLADSVEACPVFASSEQPAVEGPVQYWSGLSWLPQDEHEDVGDDELYLGLCHAWVAASILEPEPRLPVSSTRVALTATDLKALAVLDYTTITANVAGGACSFEVGDDTLTIDEDGFIAEPMSHAHVGDGLTVDEDGFIVDPECYTDGDDTLTIDEDGFIQDPGCYDGNAGTFHVLLTNFVGLQGLSFAVDRSPFDALQLAPVLSYRQSVTAGLDEADLEGVLDEVGWQLLDTGAASYAAVQTTVTYLDPRDEGALPEQAYAYVLELDEAGAITGGTWAAGNLSAAPDLFLLPVAGAAQLEGFDLASLQGLLAQSTDSDDDGVTDSLDACPSDGSGGLDADGDGCADSVYDLPALVSSLGLDRGTNTALLASAQAAAASSERGSTTSAVNQLAAFVNKVEAQRGRKIDDEDAALLIAFADNAAAGL